MKSTIYNDIEILRRYKWIIKSHFLQYPSMDMNIQRNKVYIEFI